jgi:FAD:protein FMN transferase
VSRWAMACNFEVFFNAGQHPEAVEHAIAALDAIESLEAQMTVYRPTSEISVINRTAAARPVEVEPNLYALLRHAERIHARTGGAFDITAAPLSRIWGFLVRQGRLPTAEEIDGARAAVGTQWLSFDDQRNALAFQRPGMELNLGGIGKGYALDRGAELLQGAGVENFLLHGGHSSILARGCRSKQDGWTIGLRDPLRPERRLGEVRLRNRALGTSGAANQYFYHQGKRYGHVIDPRTGRPAEHVLSATVLAPSATDADALATALYVMGLEGAKALTNSDETLSVILVCPGERAGDIGIHVLGDDADSWWRPG